MADEISFYHDTVRRLRRLGGPLHIEAAMRIEQLEAHLREIEGIARISEGADVYAYVARGALDGTRTSPESDR